MPAPAPRGLAPWRDVLVATDFSAGAARAFDRALLLPREERAKLHIVHVMPDDLPRRFAGRLRDDAARRLATLVATARDRGARAVADLRAGSSFAEVVRAARAGRCELIVLGRHGRRAVRDLFIGSTASRVVRHGEIPVLVVNRRAAVPYRRVLAAVDLDRASLRAVDLALRLGGPGASGAPGVEVVHAFAVPFEGLVTGSVAQQVRAYRKALHHDAEATLAGLLAPYEARQLRTAVRAGDPRTVILAEAKRARAEVIVLGTRVRSGVARALLGSVAEWVIEASTCDVLVGRAP